MVNVFFALFAPFIVQSTPSPSAATSGDVVSRLAQHLSSVPAAQQSRAVQARAFLEQHPGAPAAQAVPEALALLDPDFADALQAFDERGAADAVERFAKLRSNPDPFIAAAAAYFHARALIDHGLFEEAQAQLDVLAASAGRVAECSPFASHVEFLRAVAQSANLRFEDAAASLARVASDFPDAPESVQIGARQLALELDRREVGTLDEVGSYMGYVARRLSANDRDDRLRTREEETVALLDKLVKDAQQREQQQKASRSSSRKSGGKSPQQGPPSDGRDLSEAPAGGGQIGELHGVQKADPGATWGKLPPAERERILQSLRSRFPSRYRELVEQYYRSLAEEK